MPSLMPGGKQAYFDNDGNPLAGGLLYTYAAGTDTPLATYTTAAGGTPNANPVVLDARGEATIFWAAVGYKAVLHDADDAPIWTQDAIYPQATAADLTGLAPLASPAFTGTPTGLSPTPVTATGSVTARTLAARFADTVIVKDYLPAGQPDGTTDNAAGILAAIAAAAAANKALVWPAGTYVVSQEIITAHDHFTHIFQGKVTIKTTADITMFRVGAAVSDNTAYSHWTMIGDLTIEGAGIGTTSNRGLVFRNVSYGAMLGSVKITNCGATAFWHDAYARGNQYNDFGTIEVTGNYGGPFFVLDAGSTAGGYINDNTYRNIRIHENEQGGKLGAHLTGDASNSIVGNRFYSFASETQNATDSLLKIDLGAENDFFGLRLDGVTGTTTLNIASGCHGNRTWGLSHDGAALDADATSVTVGNRGTDRYPYVQLGSAKTDGTPTDAWALEVQKPGSAKELHIHSLTAGGAVRFPVGTTVLVGDRSGGDNAPIELGHTAKRLALNTLPDTAIGSGAELRWDAEYSASGDYGSIVAAQDAYGLAFTFSQTNRSLHASQAISIGDGVTAPLAVTGRAIIYVDSADGDLKVKFGDGTVKTLATDT